MPFETLDKTDNVIIVSREIDEPYFTKAINYAKSVGATVNDILVAAYIDALGKVSGMKDNESISISCATDLRRYIKDPASIGYTNHVSFIHCALKEKGEDINSIAKKFLTKESVLMEINNISSDGEIFEGKQLMIPIK